LDFLLARFRPSLASFRPRWPVKRSKGSESDGETARKGCLPRRGGGGGGGGGGEGGREGGGGRGKEEGRALALQLCPRAIVRERARGKR